MLISAALMLETRWCAEPDGVLVERLTCDIGWGNSNNDNLMTLGPKKGNLILVNGMSKTLSLPEISQFIFIK